MDWIAACDALDHHLHKQGVPDDLRMKAMAEVMTTLSRVAMTMTRVRLEQEAARLLHTGARAIAERQGTCLATVYNRARRGRALSKQGMAG